MNDSVRLRKAFGEGVFLQAASADSVQIASLQIIDALQAEEQTFKSDGSIAGYPIDGDLGTLSEADLNRAIATLLRDRNYAFNVRIRCRNSRMIGFRLSTAPTPIEVSLGMPCSQVVWAFQEDGKTVRRGSTLSPEASAMLEKLKPQ